MFPLKNMAATGYGLTSRGEGYLFMLMLHISDIHFKSPDCLKESQDPDHPIRTRMMRDLNAQLASLGEVGAILIGGDIAFKAAPDEYQAARAWIEQLCENSGCPKERVFVVPGNHDVDRGLIGNSVQIQNVQHAIALCVQRIRRTVRLPNLA